MPSKIATVNTLGTSPEVHQLAASWRKIRIIALVDAICFAANNGAHPSSSKSGHLFKQMTKLLAEDLVATKTSTLLSGFNLPLNIESYIEKEIQNINNLNVTKISVLEPAYRRSTLGISDERLSIADGSAIDNGICLELTAPRYFTDLPMLGKQSIENLTNHLFTLAQGRIQSK